MKQWNSTLENVIKRVDTNSFLSVYTPPVFQSTLDDIVWMPNTIMAQGLDSTGNNDLTSGADPGGGWGG